MTWRATYTLAWCGMCPEEVGLRAESPVTPADRTRIRRWAQAHADATGHMVSLEEGRTDQVAPRTGAESSEEQP